MEKEFALYPEALALKELGFDEPCLGYYDGNHNLQYMFNGYPESFSKRMMGVSDSVWVGWISAPTFSQAFRFFREKYELSCSVELTDNSRHYYFDFTIYDSKNRDYNDEDCFDSCKRIYDKGKYGTYEEAELACLQKLIEIAESK